MNSVFVLAINPGSTSTKIAVFEDTNPLFIQTLRHTKEELEKNTKGLPTNFLFAKI